MNIKEKWSTRNLKNVPMSIIALYYLTLFECKTRYVFYYFYVFANVESNSEIYFVRAHIFELEGMLG